MKLMNELNTVVAALQTIADKIPTYADELKICGGYADFETRLAWDCMRYVMGINWICEMYAKYNCTDAHLTTLAKRALREVYKV